MSIVANPLENPLELDVDQLDWPSDLPDHLSASQLSMFQRCPEQFRRRYLLKMKDRPGAALVWGKADHAAHETNFRQKIDSGEDISEDDVKIAFAENFDSEIDSFGDEIEWGTEKPGSLKDQGVNLVGLYHRTISPSVQPVAVEQKFTVDLPGVPVPVIGYVDVKTADVAIERKTAKRAETKVKPEWRIQGLLYQAVGESPVDYHVSVKTKTPAVYAPPLPEPPLFGDFSGEPELRLYLNERTVEATKVLVQNSARAMLAYWRMFGPDSPWPGAITHPWACGFCAWKPQCAWWTV